MLDTLLASQALAGGAFDRIAAQGLVAESMTPAAVSSTPVSHATIFSGAWPARHGITGVSLPGETLTGELRSGFDVATSVDRLWTVAQRAGKRVVCIVAPGAQATAPADTCTETLPFAAVSRPPASDAPMSPDGFAARIRQALGPSPGEPDARRVTRAEMSDEEYITAAERFAEYLGAVVRQQLARSDWDLLITYMPVIDNAAHRYLLSDPRQAEYDEEGGARRQRFAGYIQRAWKEVDAIVGGWLSAAPETTFVITSDHGMIPTHSTVLLSNLLAAAGLRVGGNDAQVRVLHSGATAQIYVNASSRFHNGTVPDAQIASVTRKIVNVCRSVIDPATGKAVFSAVVTRDGFRRLNLQHAAAGDVYVAASPGWGVSSRFDPAVPTFVRNTLSPDARERLSRSPAEERFLEAGALNELSLGVHGHPPGDPRTQALFMTVGPGVPHRHVGTVEMTDVAPTVLALLGISRPSSMTGRRIW